MGAKGHGIGLCAPLLKQPRPLLPHPRLLCILCLCCNRRVLHRLPDGAKLTFLFSTLEITMHTCPPPSPSLPQLMCRCVLHRLPEDADLVILDFGINDFQKGDALIHPERQAFERILRRALSLPK